MMKYSLVLHHLECGDFLGKLQGLGMVDVTVSDWEADEPQREHILKMERLRKAVSELSSIVPDKERTGEPFAGTDEAFEKYLAASDEMARLRLEQQKLQKEIEEAEPWGEFSPGEIDRLKGEGVTLHFFTSPKKEFDSMAEQWREEYVVEEISVVRGTSYFVVVTRGDETVSIDALEVKTPDATAEKKKTELAGVEKSMEEQEDVLKRCAVHVDGLRKMEKSMQEELYLSKINTTAVREADGTLVILEGWATEDTQVKVDELLESSPVVYIKEEPQGEDAPPVLLKNNRFARLFEVIGNFYDLPKYGTYDLTPYFAPFYMLFFGFCLADAGYGLIYTAAALIAMAKLPKEYKGFAKLVLCCGLSTMFFGLLTGNAFGIELMKQPLFEPINKYMIDSDQLFSLALAVGVIHILFAMLLKVIFTAKRQGFKYSLSSLGWMIVIISGLGAALLPQAGVESYTMSSPAFWVITALGLFLMLFMNSPGKNPFVNFGLGLWNTYNDVTGLLSDVLSYIRLFALGLSGGILALVFNRLAMEMSGDIIVLKQIIMVLILAVGQGLTIFMSSLSAFVHPLRLTFVEFYKNAGFEGGGRAFNPLKKETDEN